MPGGYSLPHEFPLENEPALKSSKTSNLHPAAGGGFLARSPIFRAFKLFFSAPASHPYLVLACVLFAGVLEALSFGSLVPAVALVGGSNDRLDCAHHEDARVDLRSHRGRR